MIAILAVIPVVAYVIWPRGYELLRGSEADFSVRVPSGWDREHNHRFTWELTRTAGLQPQGAIMVSFVAVSNAPAEPDVNVVSVVISGLRARYPQLAVQQNEPAEVNGLKGYRLVYLFSKMVGGLPVEAHKAGQVILWRRDQGMYVVTLDTKYDTWDAYKADYEKIVESLRAPAE